MCAVCTIWAVHDGLFLSVKFSLESQIFGRAASRVNRKGPSFLSRLKMIIDVEVNLTALLIAERFWRRYCRILSTLWAKSWFGKAFVPGPSCQRLRRWPQLPLQLWNLSLLLSSFTQSGPGKCNPIPEISFGISNIPAGSAGWVNSTGPSKLLWLNLREVGKKIGKI